MHESSRERPIMLAGVAVVMWALSLWSQGAAQSAEMPVAVVQDFLKSMYPELRGKNYVMAIEADGAFDVTWTRLPGMNVQVGQTEPGHRFHLGQKSGRSKQVERKPILGARFEFDRDGRIREVVVHGASIVNEDRNEAIRKLVDSHRTWSDQQVIQALKKADVRYGPGEKQALLKAIPLGELEKFLGSVTVQSSEFQLRHQQPGGSLATLHWAVEVEARRAGARPIHYTLIFEPFQGRLTSVFLYASDTTF